MGVSNPLVGSKNSLETDTPDPSDTKSNTGPRSDTFFTCFLCVSLCDLCHFVVSSSLHVLAPSRSSRLCLELSCPTNQSPQSVSRHLIHATLQRRFARSRLVRASTS